MGCVCVYSLSNPSFPDFTYTTPSGVMTLDFNTTLMPTLLVCGLYDGSIMVFDLGKRDPKTLGPEKAPVAQSTMSTGAHMDPVWQVQWSRENAYSFFTISSDGRFMEGVVTASELQVEERFVFDRALDRAAMDALDEDEPAVALITVVFTEPGSLGLRFSDNRNTGGVDLVQIQPGSQAEQHPELLPLAPLVPSLLS